MDAVNTCKYAVYVNAAHSRQDWFTMYFVKAAEVPSPVVCPDCKMPVLPAAVPVTGKCLPDNTITVNSSVRFTEYEMPSGSAFSKRIFSGDIFWRGDYYYVGVEDMDTMFNKCVTQNIEL